MKQQMRQKNQKMYIAVACAFVAVKFNEEMDPDTALIYKLLKIAGSSFETFQSNLFVLVLSTILYLLRIYIIEG